MKNEDTIFLNALDLPPEQRASYLDEACAGAPALRARIERLLALDSSENEIIDQSPIDRGVLAAEEQPDAVIDRYTLVRRIGEGGCGVVWLAEQTAPVRRTVALKIIRLGMNTAAVIQRFEAERQALAMMDHPDIARVFDAGATEAGRPFFVMEYVDGVPITTYCDEHQLGVAERLKLFNRACEAIQHAHQKGIIHRDVKPSNVLVAAPPSASGEAMLKVIDFGIAKATEQRLTEATLVTQLGQFVGTPAYMSPEQSGSGGGDVDTRTDVYSLGVLLYELLAGAPPFEPKALVAAGLEAMWKQIREVDPPRPSTRLRTLSPEELRTTATRRVIDPPKLIHRISGDLDWIVMRCLEKDRARRYATAAGLAADIARHLSDEPIEARPAGAGYRFAKLVRRNRLAFGAAAAVVLALIVGTAASTWQAVRANRAEEAARREAEIARAVNAFLQTDLLRQADPNIQADTFDTADPDLKVRDALDRAAQNVGTRFADQPVTEAALRLSIGEAYLGLGLAAEAAPHLERALQLRREHLGEHHPDTLLIQHYLGNAWRDAGQLDAATAILRDLVAITEATDASEDARLDAKSALGLALQKQGEYAEAGTLLQDVFERRERLEGPETVKTLRALRNLGSVAYLQGKLEEAEQIHRRTLEIHRRVSGPLHPSTFAALNNVAATARSRGEYIESTQLQEEAYAIATR
ncbi:MAG: protein kinase domain-containing protein, partial [Giesbergeria sp.]